MDQPGRVCLIEDRDFAFFDTICVSVNGQLLAIKFFRKEKKNTFTKFEKTGVNQQVKKTELAPPPKFRKDFALCLIEDRYLLLTGGKDENFFCSNETFLFDLESGQWLVEPSQPNIVEARSEHASCATD